jgi:hypothetical protein
MRQRELLVGLVLMFLILASAKATPPLLLLDAEIDLNGSTKGPAGVPDASMLEPSPLIAADKTIGSAYYDTLSILSSNNPCTDFFGGSAVAVEVFNRLISGVRKDHLAAAVGVRMSGSTTDVLNATTSRQYRIFEKVSINVDGPFFRKRFSSGDVNVPRIGRYDPNTKEIRVLILLHELGHAIKGADGDWLLPNDGKDLELSRINSRRIQDVCGEQINSIGDAGTMLQLARKKGPEQKLALSSPRSTP